jgi:hypothetical protein
MFLSWQYCIALVLPLLMAVMSLLEYQNHSHKYRVEGSTTIAEVVFWHTREYAPIIEKKQF